MSANRPQRLVVGVGNRQRCDDGVGPLAASRVAAMGLPDLEVVEHTGELSSLLELWEGRTRVVVVDALRGGSRWSAGSIVRFDARAESLPSRAFTSTHAFSVAEAIELGRALGQLPPHLVVLGLAAAWFEHGESLSAPVSEALDGLVRRVVGELEGA